MNDIVKSCILGLIYLAMIVVIAASCSNANAAIPSLTETRTGAVDTIARSQSVLDAFQNFHPCPSTGKTSGACPGWIKDHVIPRHCGGKDEVDNLQWQPTAMSKLKDTWEIKIYCTPMQIVK